AAGLIMAGLMYAYFFVNPELDQQLLLPYCIYAFLFVCGQSLTSYSTAIFYTSENYFLPNFLLGVLNIVFVLIIPSKNDTVNVSETDRIIYIYFFFFLIVRLFCFLFFL